MDISLANPHVAWTAFALIVLAFGAIIRMAGNNQHDKAIQAAGAYVIIGGIFFGVVANAAVFVGVGLPGMGGGIVPSDAAGKIEVVLTSSQTGAMASCDIGQTQAQPTITLVDKWTGQGYTTTSYWRTYMTRDGQLNKGGWNSFTSGTQFGTTITPGSKIEIVIGNGTSSEYGPNTVLTVPCESNPVFNIEGVTAENAAGMTSTFLDSRGANAAEVPSASGQSTFYIEYKTASRESYGNPFIVDKNGNPVKYPNELWLTLTSANWSSIDEVWMDDAPNDCDCVGALPKIGTNDYATRNLVNSNNISSSYGAPAMMNNQKYTVGVKATASSNAADADSSTFWLFAGNHFIYDNNALGGLANEVGFGVIDRLANLVGLSQANTETTQGNFA